MSAETMTREPQTLAAMKAGRSLMVWTYEVPAIKNDGFWLEMPAGARVVGVSRNATDVTPKIRAVVNPAMPKTQRFFYVALTNTPLPDPEGVKTNPPGIRFSAMEYIGNFVGWQQTLDLFELPVVKEREPGEEE